MMPIRTRVRRLSKRRIPVANRDRHGNMFWRSVSPFELILIFYSNFLLHCKRFYQNICVQLLNTSYPFRNGKLSVNENN